MQSIIDYSDLIRSF